MGNKFQQGINLFNRKEFFEAHEVWEALWKESKDEEERQFLQGLIQIAAGLHKFLNMKNAAGGEWLLTRGLGRLPQENVRGLDLNSLRAQTEAALKSMKSGEPLAEPKIRLL